MPEDLLGNSFVGVFSPTVFCKVARENDLELLKDGVEECWYPREGNYPFSFDVVNVDPIYGGFVAQGQDIFGRSYFSGKISEGKWDLFKHYYHLESPDLSSFSVIRYSGNVINASGSQITGKWYAHASAYVEEGTFVLKEVADALEIIRKGNLEDEILRSQPTR